MSARCIGLVANVSKPTAAELVRLLIEEFAHHEVQLRLEKETAELVGKTSAFSTHDLCVHCELLLVLGGDGTILQVLRAAGEKLPPVFGVNLGTLGFLTTVASTEIHEAVKAVVSSQYELSQRTLLRVDVFQEGNMVSSGIALNDAVISRGNISRLIWLEVSIGNDPLTTYHADGLIVATPTGSTAYSLSAGGPVLSPESGVFVVNPICPHVLTNRAVIVSDEAPIEIRAAQERMDTFLSLDGQTVRQIEENDVIRITKAAEKLSLAMLPGMTFYEVLRQKLKWGGSMV